MFENIKKNDGYFSSKTCNICGKKAIKYRLIKNRHFYLCGDKICDEKTEKITGFKTEEKNG